ncbi:MAG: hypothetical protein K9H16_09310 [Bacteroidales bacterium]|nr:hypothetical protein [Bacteroidales bacterium]
MRKKVISCFQFRALQSEVWEKPVAFFSLLMPVNVRKDENWPDFSEVCVIWRTFKPIRLKIFQCPEY